MTSRALRMLYREVPEMKCRSGCTDCCGPVPWSVEEWAKVEADAALLSIETFDLGEGARMVTVPGKLKCPFATAQGCAVRDRRPFMCRLFGAADDPRLRCPHGCRPKRLLTAGQAASLRARYIGGG